MIFDSSTDSFSENILSLFPMLLDYDFKNNRPRGMSLKLDILSGGNLSKAIDMLHEVRPPLFLRKSDIFIKNGFFLYDLKNTKDLNDFLESFIISNNFNNIYIEKTFSITAENLQNKIKLIENF